MLFRSELDADTKARLALGQRIVEVLKQKNEAPVPVEHQVCIIYALVKGYLNDIELTRIHAFEERLREHMTLRHEDVLQAILTAGKLSKETEEKLVSAIKEHKSEF